jgi:hypothetical protein
MASTFQRKRTARPLMPPASLITVATWHCEPAGGTDEQTGMFRRFRASRASSPRRRLQPSTMAGPRPDCGRGRRTGHISARPEIKAQQSRMEVSLGRATGPAEEATDMEIPDPGPGPEGAMVRRQDLGQVDKALNALPVALRECLVLRDWRSFPTRILRRSPASRSVRSCRAFRARQALQKGAINIVSQQAGSHLPGNVVATAGVDTSRAG